MAREPTTWIKLDRNIVNWRWFWDDVTFRVWIYLLLTAEIKDREIGKSTIHRGSVLTNYDRLADTLGLTYAQVRRACDNLRFTQEIATSQHGKFVEISILKYNEYQGENATKTQPKHNLNTTDHYKNNKNIKNTLSLSLSQKPYHIPSLDEVREYERASGLGKDPEAFYEHYSKEGWKAQGKKIYNWQRLYDNWKEPEKVIKVKFNHPRYTDEDGFTYEWDENKNRYELVARPKKGRVKHEDDEG